MVTVVTVVPGNLEAGLVTAALTVRSCMDFAATLKQAGHGEWADTYNQTAHNLAARLRARPATLKRGTEWYLIHAHMHARLPARLLARSLARSALVHVRRYSDYGVHAAAYLVDAKIVATEEEYAPIFAQVRTHACSSARAHMYACGDFRGSH